MIEGLALALIAFVLVVLALSQVHLYRVASDGVRSRELFFDPWPLKELKAGDGVPDGVVPPLWSGLLLICADDRDEYAAVASAAAVSADWGVPLVFAQRFSGDPTNWEVRAPETALSNNVILSAKEFLSIGVRHTPALLAVGRGRILDALQDPASPSIVADKLQYVAAPLQSYVTEWDTVQHTSTSHTGNEL